MNLLFLRKIVQVETLFWLNFVQVITCTGQNCTSFDLFFLCRSSYNLYNILIVQVITCIKSQLVHIYILVF
jgi:hypothetical protein